MKTFLGWLLIVISITMSIFCMARASSLPRNASFVQALPILGEVLGAFLLAYIGGRLFPVRPGRRSFFSSWF